MSANKIGSIQNHFAKLTDPRQREPTNPQVNVVVMSLCAVISWADDFMDIVHWYL